MESGDKTAGEGLRHLSERLQGDPDSPLFLPLARAYQSEGKLEEAIDLCLKGLKRHPSYVSARVALGALYLEAGNLEEGALELKRAIGEAPQNLLARRLLADIYERRGERAAALETLEQLARLSPLGRELEERMARLRGREEPVPAGAPEGAAVEEALPTESLAKLYESQGLFAEALETYEKLLERDPENQHLQEKVKVLGEWSSGEKAAPEAREEAEAPVAEKPAGVTVEEGAGIEAISEEAETEAPFEEKELALEGEGVEPVGAVEAPAVEEEALEAAGEAEPTGAAITPEAEIERIEEEPEGAVSEEAAAPPEEEAAPGEARIEAILEESSLEEALAEYTAALAEDPSDQSLQEKVREISEKLGREVPPLVAAPSEAPEQELGPGAPPGERAGEQASVEKINGHEEAVRNLQQWLENIERETKGDQEKAR